MPPSEAACEVICFLNAAAGTCDPAIVTDLFERIAAESGATARVVVPEPGSDLTALAREAVASGARIVVAGGGDGTVNAVAASVAGNDADLGVLPLGTLNHFAKDLGIPLAPEEAIRNVFAGKALAVDVGEVNGRIFLNNSSLGLYPRIVRQREAHQSRGVRKWTAFILALAYVARNHSKVHLRIKIDAERAELRKTPFVFIGNNKYQISGLEIGKRHSLTGGRIWVCKAPTTDRLGLLALTLRALTGRLKERDLEAAEAKEIWVETRLPRIDVATDGEVNTMDAPLHYRCRPAALKVIVPKPAIETKK